MIGVYEITEPDKQRTVYKPYYFTYEENVKTKHWVEGVFKTRKGAEDSARKAVKKLKK